MPIPPFYPSEQMANFASINCTALQSGQDVTDTDGLFGTAGAKVKVSNSFNNCPYTGSSNYDYWLAAKLKCESQGLRLPKETELAKIAAAIYGYTGDVNQDWSYSGTRGDISAYGFELYGSYSLLSLWSGAEYPSHSNSAYSRYLSTGNTYRNYDRRNNYDFEALCVGE